NWKKTRINDKPGITVGMISGLGLLYDRHPEDLRSRSEEKTENNLFTLYDETRTEKVNMALRSPILLLAGLMLLYFYWVIRKFTGSQNLGALTALLLAVSPILLGISQIINPDAFLWSFSGAAVFSYLALLRTREKKFIFLAALFVGLSLLSKYTANILFPTFLFLFYGYYFLESGMYEKIKESRQYFLWGIAHLLAIYAGSLLVFSVFLPAVFVKFKYLSEGTFLFPGFKILIIPILMAFALTLLDAVFNKNGLLRSVGRTIFAKRDKIVKIGAGFFLFIILFQLVNSWTGQKIVPLDMLRHENYYSQDFTFGALVEKDNPIWRNFKVFMAESYPFIFSLGTLNLLVLLVFLTLIIIKGSSKNHLEIFFLAFFPVLYFLAMMQSGVLANARYSIMLYPLGIFFSALALVYFLENIQAIRNFPNRFWVAVSLVGICGFFSLFFSKPFYFNYTSWLLPKKFMISDSWGYGSYEAAQYLNSLPDAKNLKVWTDRSTLCQFLAGKCIRDYKIDLSKVKPDYFVFSRRGQIRHRFIWLRPDLAKLPASDYYEKEKPVWRLDISGREKNFVRIVKSRE
ncbi:MAG: glycosyltransferase family 39 protein, partial [Patescibacteria group bacterium]